MTQLPDAKNHRQADHKIDDIFIERWSPRAMSGEAITEAELNSLFEAARWAPSSNNEQPWHFLYARRDTPNWEKFFNLLVPGNQTWNTNAGVLMVILSRQTFTRNQKPNRVHMFDAGAAWQNLALQGARLGLVVHGMGGFDAVKAQEILNIPADYSVIAMLSVGRPGEVNQLPEPLQSREVPSGRKKVAEFTQEGGF